MIDYLRAVKCPELEKLLKKFDTIEKRAKISLNNYLGKQPLTSPLQTNTHSDWKYYGELKADGEPHGRGIRIWLDGGIWIGYWWRWYMSTGNYIMIFSDGEFRVGEFYMK